MPSPSRIVTLWERQRDGTLGDVAPANFVDWRDASRSFTRDGGDECVQLRVQLHSWRTERGGAVGRRGRFVELLFRTRASGFMLGRNFLPEEDRPGQNRVAILSYPAWRDRFGADRDIVGKAITLDDKQLHGRRCAAGGFSVRQHGGGLPGAQPSRHLGSARARSSEVAAELAHAARDRPAQPGVTLRRPRRSSTSSRRTWRRLYPEKTTGQGHRGCLVDGAGHGDCSRAVGDPARRGRTGAADRLRERREPPVEPGGGAPDGDGGPGRARCKPRGGSRNNC